MAWCLARVVPRPTCISTYLNLLVLLGRQIHCASVKVCFFFCFFAFLRTQSSKKVHLWRTHLAPSTSQTKEKDTLRCVLLKFTRRIRLCYSFCRREIRNMRFGAIYFKSCLPGAGTTGVNSKKQCSSRSQQWHVCGQHAKPHISIRQFFRFLFFWSYDSCARHWAKRTSPHI